jgi:hypothetical protein
MEAKAMSKIKDHYCLWLVEQMGRQDQLIVLGFLIWIKWRRILHFPRIDPEVLARWASLPFFLLGSGANNYERLSSWWSDQQLLWVIRMW